MRQTGSRAGDWSLNKPRFEGASARCTNGLAVRPAPLRLRKREHREGHAVRCIKNPDLMKCNLGTIKIGVVQAAELGLDSRASHRLSGAIQGRARLIVSYIAGFGNWPFAADRPQHREPDRLRTRHLRVGTPSGA